MIVDRNSPHVMHSMLSNDISEDYTVYDDDRCLQTQPTSPTGNRRDEGCNRPVTERDDEGERLADEHETRRGRGQTTYQEETTTEFVWEGHGGRDTSRLRQVRAVSDGEEEHVSGKHRRTAQSDTVPLPRLVRRAAAAVHCMVLFMLLSACVYLTV